MLTKFSSVYDIEWHYFQANHGKGAVDGVGGTIKNTVFRKVQAKDVVIQGPKHFAEFADSILPSISVIYIKDSKSSYEEECRKNAIKIPGTLKVHKIVREVIPFGFKLTFFDTSANVRDEIKQKTYTSTKVTIRKTRKKNN